MIEGRYKMAWSSLGTNEVVTKNELAANIWCDGLSSGYYVSAIKFPTYGNSSYPYMVVCFVGVNYTYFSSNHNQQTIGRSLTTLPSEFRPSMTIGHDIAIEADWNNTVANNLYMGSSNIRVFNSGAVTIYGFRNANKGGNNYFWLSGSVSWLRSS